MYLTESKAQEVIRSLPQWFHEITQELASVKGVAGIVLGGSQARGTAKKDSDYDIGIYYHAESFDWESIKAIARKYDDQGAPQGLAAPGEWGPWINGGGWLTLQKNRVDLLLRDYQKVSNVISDCEKGVFTTHYQIGHPSAFYSYMWMGEVRVNLRVQDPKGELQALHARTVEYPRALQKAISGQFFWEAEFSLSLLKKLKERDDPYYLSGLLFRYSSCLLQALFALNRQYFMNEKGAVEFLSQFGIKPKGFAERLNQICSTIPPVDAPSYESGTHIAGRAAWLSQQQQLLDEVRICIQSNL